MRRLLAWFLAKIIATEASFDWFDLYDSRTGELDNLDRILNYRSADGSFRYENSDRVLKNLALRT